MNLDAASLVSPKEKACFILALVVAIAAWLVLTLFTMGMVWFILAILAVVVWFSNGLLVAGLRADAVAVHPQQVGRLDATFREVCATLGLANIPELYVVQSGGLLNAFATRHAGRHFVVVYSDMLEALGPDSAEMRFLLGHEIGHIQRQHVFKRLLLAPALFLPILGPAYSRACESTCDRFGALAAGSVDASMRAMVLLAGGKEAGREMDVHHFAEQNRLSRGFFISWYELISGYPTLSRRARDLRQLGGAAAEPAPRRNPLAYVFALFTFGGGFGGRGSMLTTLILIYMVAIFAAMAIPAVDGAMKKARELQREEQAQELQEQAP